MTRYHTTLKQKKVPKWHVQDMLGANREAETSSKMACPRYAVANPEAEKSKLVLYMLGINLEAQQWRLLHALSFLFSALFI